MKFGTYMRKVCHSLQLKGIFDIFKFEREIQIQKFEFSILNCDSVLDLTWSQFSTNLDELLTIDKRKQLEKIVVSDFQIFIFLVGNSNLKINFHCKWQILLQNINFPR